MDAQLQIRQNALEAQDYMKDLMDWTKSMKQKAGSKASKQQADQDAPAVRGKAAGTVQCAPAGLQKPSMQQTRPAGPRNAPPAAHTYTHYSKWDKFNPDAASDDEEQPNQSIRQQPAVSVRQPQPAQPAATAAANGTDKQAAAEQAAPSATALKDRGNKLFQAGYYDDAVKCYTQSIAQQPTAVAYGNRAMAHLKLSRYAEAEQDCNSALQLDSMYIKALHRRGTARKQLGKLLEAACDFEEALRLEPTNATVQADRDAAVEQYLKKHNIQRSSIWSSIPVVGQQQQAKASSKLHVQSHEEQQQGFDTQQQNQQQAPSSVAGVEAPAFQQEEPQQHAAPLHASTPTPAAAAESLPELANNVAEDSKPAPAATVGTSEENSSEARHAAAAASPAAAAAAIVQPLNSSPSKQSVPSRGPSPQQTSVAASAAAAAAAAAAAQLAARRAASLKPPKTGNDFESAWRSFKGDKELQAKYLALVAPHQLPVIFKTALTAPILSAILNTVLAAAAESNSNPSDSSETATGGSSSAVLGAVHAVRLIEHLVNVPRFDMTVMCLTSRDKANLRQQWDAAAASVAACRPQLAEQLSCLRAKYRL